MPRLNLSSILEAQSAPEMEIRDKDHISTASDIKHPRDVRNTHCVTSKPRIRPNDVVDPGSLTFSQFLDYKNHSENRQGTSFMNINVAVSPYHFFHHGCDCGFIDMDNL